MKKITILGAGAMGSALCTPLIDSGWEVRLWGTWLDDHLLDAVENGQPHPRTNEPLADGVKLFRSDELEAAMEDADVIVMSVASVGVPKVTEMALPGIDRAEALWLTSKGFCPDEDGKIELLPDTVRRIGRENGYPELPPIVAIAGPVKANECAARKPTATIFGSRDSRAASSYSRSAATPNYGIEPSNDEVGVELCAPMKNVYAIALGISDGLEEATSIPHHNLKAATFSQAVKEMSVLSTALGADPQTAFGLAGVGDLEVTGLSGRNKVYGVRLGRGEAPKAAHAEMERLEQTVEGIPAAGLAQQLVQQKTPELEKELPLLAAVNDILGGATPVKDLIAKAVLPRATD